MTTYVHLPTKVQAVQWLGRREDIPDSWQSSGAFRFAEDGSLTVTTGKGEADVNVGDYILLSSWEEFWPIAEPKFLASYKAQP